MASASVHAPKSRTMNLLTNERSFWGHLAPPLVMPPSTREEIDRNVMNTLRRLRSEFSSPHVSPIGLHDPPTAPLTDEELELLLTHTPRGGETLWTPIVEGGGRGVSSPDTRGALQEFSSLSPLPDAVVAFLRTPTPPEVKLMGRRSKRTRKRKRCACEGCTDLQGLNEAVKSGSKRVRFISHAQDLLDACNAGRVKFI